MTSSLSTAYYNEMEFTYCMMHKEPQVFDAFPLLYIYMYALWFLNLSSLYTGRLDQACAIYLLKGMLLQVQKSCPHVVLQIIGYISVHKQICDARLATSVCQPCTGEIKLVYQDQIVSCALFSIWSPFCACIFVVLSVP